MVPSAGQIALCTVDLVLSMTQRGWSYVRMSLQHSSAMALFCNKFCMAMSCHEIHFFCVGLAIHQRLEGLEGQWVWASARGWRASWGASLSKLVWRPFNFCTCMYILIMADFLLCMSCALRVSTFMHK